jgi:hypothetical protein
MFNCPATITISASGVVLRGSGATGEQRSTIKMSGKPHLALAVRRGGGGRGNQQAATREADLFTAHVTDAYVSSGATTITVSDAKGFAVGDTVVIRRPVTEAWLRFMQMHDMTRNGKPQTWIKAGSTTDHERRVAAVDGNRITLDVPLPDSFDSTYLDPPGTVVAKIAPPQRLMQVGIENLHIESPPQEISHSQPHHTALRMNGQDCWVRDVAIDETMNSVSVGGRRITLQRVSIHRKAAHQGASKPAEFAPNGTQVLMDRCAVTGDNVWYVATGGNVSGPIAVLNCTFKGNGRAESHQRWSTGILYDNVRVDSGGIELRNRGSMGSGHGWSMGWGVLWNCNAAHYIVQNPPGALNWMIGCAGESRLSPRPFGSGPNLPAGEMESHGTPVTPASLYISQLKDRLGEQALKNIGYATENDVAPVEAPARAHGEDARDLALNRPVSASDVRNDDRRFAGWNALDGNDATYWATDDGVKNATLELDTEGAVEVNAVELGEALGFENRVREYKVEGMVDSDWKLLSRGDVDRLKEARPVSKGDGVEGATDDRGVRPVPRDPEAVAVSGTDVGEESQNATTVAPAPTPPASTETETRSARPASRRSPRLRSASPSRNRSPGPTRTSGL